MIDELIERVESGEGADRAIDGDIFVALGPDHATKLLRHFAREAPAYTTSLDAVLALIEEKLPGQTIEILREAISATSKRFHLHICFETPDAARFLPRAALAAALRAYKEQHDASR